MRRMKVTHIQHTHASSVGCRVRSYDDAGSPFRVAWSLKGLLLSDEWMRNEACLHKYYMSIIWDSMMAALHMRAQKKGWKRGDYRPTTSHIASAIWRCELWWEYIKSVDTSDSVGRLLLFHFMQKYVFIPFRFTSFFVVVAFSSWSLRVSSPPIAVNWKYCICVRACVRFSVCTRPYCCYIYCLIFRIRFVKECQTICPFFSCWLPSHCDASPNDIWPSGGFGR